MDQNSTQYKQPLSLQQRMELIIKYREIKRQQSNIVSKNMKYFIK